MRMSLFRVIERGALRALETQGADGEFPAGHNGPYRDAETPVRNTAHWLTTLCYLYHHTGERRWYDGGHRASAFLLNEVARPRATVFHCRTNPMKDATNGVIGQAWAIEGLITAGTVLGREDAWRVAREVFFLHPFADEQGVWSTVGIDGSEQAVDTTFNHQLWFAAIGALLDDREADARAWRFLDRVGSRVQIYRQGIVYHRSRVPVSANGKSTKLRGVLRTTRSALSALKGARALRSKSVGYHAFNLYALALLKKRFPAHDFWTSHRFGRMLNVTTLRSFVRDLPKSAYGYPYNPPGIELAFTGEVFGLGRDYREVWLRRQTQMTYNRTTGELLTRMTPDVVTSAARIYEATRLEDSYSLDLSEASEPTGVEGKET